MDSNKTENIIIELTTNAETNAVTVKPAPKKRAPKKQPVVVETNAVTVKPAPKKRAPKKQNIIIINNTKFAQPKKTFIYQKDWICEKCPGIILKEAEEHVIFKPFNKSNSFSMECI